MISSRHIYTHFCLLVYGLVDGLLAGETRTIRMMNQRRLGCASPLGDDKVPIMPDVF